MSRFGSSKRHTFKPTAYGSSSRKRRRIPRWLVLLLTGIALGSGGLLFLQKNYGPVRLTAEQSEQLHYDLNSANIDKQRLQSQLNQQTRELDELRTRFEQQTKELTSVRDELTQLYKDVEPLADAVAPDPRGTSPGIRAARFRNADGQLAYQILVMQDADKADQRFEGKVEFVVTGRYPNGRTGVVDLPPLDIAVGRYVHMDGSIDLPNGLSAREVVIKITRNGESRMSATRTLRVAP